MTNQVSFHSIQNNTYFTALDENEQGEMPACQPETKNKDGEEENGMVTIVVTLDEELLRRADADLAARAITRYDV